MIEKVKKKKLKKNNKYDRMMKKNNLCVCEHEYMNTHTVWTCLMCEW